jgi:hypothetical protein
MLTLSLSFPNLTKLEFDGGMVHPVPAFQQLSRLTRLRELHLTHDEHGEPPTLSARHLPPSLVHVTAMSMSLAGPQSLALPALLSLDLEWSSVLVSARHQATPGPLAGHHHRSHHAAQPPAGRLTPTLLPAAAPHCPLPRHRHHAPCHTRPPPHTPLP